MILSDSVFLNIIMIVNNGMESIQSIDIIERILKIAPGDYYIAPSLDIVDLVRKDLAVGIDVQDYFNNYIGMLAALNSKYVFDYLEELKGSI